MVRVHQLRSFHLLISVIISTDLTIILLIPEKNVVFSQYVVKEICQKCPTVSGHILHYSSQHAFLTIRTHKALCSRRYVTSADDHSLAAFQIVCVFF